MPSQALLLRIAPLIFVSLWSTGFIAAKYSMQNADPFVFLCLRFTITAVALIPILLLFGAVLPRRIWSFRHDMVTGALLHCGYLGFLFWPIKNGVPSGIVAIIIGVQPILTMILASLYIGEHLDFRKVAGLLIGFVGISIVIIGKYGITLGLSGGLDLFDLGMCLVATIAGYADAIRRRVASNRVLRPALQRDLDNRLDPCLRDSADLAGVGIVDWCGYAADVHHQER
jgi:drug/metabolite transporter (DMT)-like permease